MILQPILRRALIVASVVSALAVTAPAAAASVVPLNATDFSRSAGHNGTPSCPDGAVTCGTGTDTTFGDFTIEVFLGAPGTQTAVLRFADGTLALDETATGAEAPGKSFDSHASPNTDGRPVYVTGSWTVDSASDGIFQGAAGTGTADVRASGIEFHDVLDGTLTLTS
jgi:hypothetical protein